MKGPGKHTKTDNINTTQCTITQTELDLFLYILWPPTKTSGAPSLPLTLGKTSYNGKRGHWGVDRRGVRGGGEGGSSPQPSRA